MSGSNWTDDDNTIVMNVGATKYSITSGDYSSKISLSDTVQDIVTIDTENTMDVFLQLKSELIDLLFVGDLTQDIEVNLVC